MIIECIFSVLKYGFSHTPYTLWIFLRGRGYEEKEKTKKWQGLENLERPDEFLLERVRDEFFEDEKMMK